MVASVVPWRETVAVTRALAAVVVVLTLGFPPNPLAVLIAIRGAACSNPVKEAAASLIASILRLMVTLRLLEPVAGVPLYVDTPRGYV